MTHDLPRNNVPRLRCIEPVDLILELRPHIGREPDVELWCEISVLEDVDEPLVSRHALAKASWNPTLIWLRQLDALRDVR